jgi:hypothetical protein
MAMVSAGQDLVVAADVAHILDIVEAHFEGAAAAADSVGRMVIDVAEMGVYWRTVPRGASLLRSSAVPVTTAKRVCAIRQRVFNRRNPVPSQSMLALAATKQWGASRNRW